MVATTVEKLGLNWVDNLDDMLVLQMVVRRVRMSAETLADVKGLPKAGKKVLK